MGTKTEPTNHRKQNIRLGRYARPCCPGGVCGMKHHPEVVKVTVPQVRIVLQGPEELKNHG